MSKRLALSLLGFGAGLAGNLVAGWIQQEVFQGVFTPARIMGMVIGAGLMLLVLAWLESERALARNWRWHRFWYFWEASKEPEFVHWEKDFARLQLARRPRSSAEVEVIVDGARQDLIQVLHNVVSGQQENSRRALILGEPGSGKTTGLERLMLDLTRKGVRRLGIDCPIPVLVRLGNFQKGKLLDYVGQALRHTVGRKSGCMLGAAVEDLVGKGQVILLFDALDEALGQRREEALAELDDLLRSRVYRNAPILITSRTRQDPKGRLARLQVFEIQDLNDEAVKVFIRAYRNPAHSDEEIWERLEKHKLLEPQGLGRNPFWLKLAVGSGAFIGNKAQIVDDAVDTLLARELEEKAETRRSWRRVLPHREQLKETKRGLGWLAYQMSKANKTAIDEDQALMLLLEWQKTRVGIEKLRPQDVLGLGQDAQVLEYSSDPILFRHRLLQEFMTAWTIVFEKGLLTSRLVEDCTQNTVLWQTLFLIGGLLGAYRPSEAYIELVYQALGDGTNNHGLLVAIGLLQSIEDPPEYLTKAVTEALVSNVGEELTDQQRSLTHRLGTVLGGEAAEAFGVFFRSRDRRIKLRGIALLCALGQVRASEILIAGLRDDYEWGATAEILVRIGAAAVNPLMAALNATDDYVREYAATILGRIGKPAVKPLIAAMDSADVRVRWHATGALRLIGGESAVELLLSLLLDPDVRVRGRAASALGEIGDSRSAWPLADLLKDSNTWVHVNAANALRKIGAPAVAPLIDALYSPNSYVRGSAAEILGYIAAPQSLPELERVAKEDTGSTLWGGRVADIASAAAKQIRQSIQ
jgi:HEAT repeat protein